MPKGTDLGFLNRMDAAHGRNPSFCMLWNTIFYLLLSCLDHDKRDKDLFSVAHFAGLVPYSIAGWLDKNKDTLNMDLVTALGTSKNELIKEIFSDAGRAIALLTILKVVEPYRL